MTTFQVYRFSPEYLREEIHRRLAYSIKKLVEALPQDQFEVFAPEAEALFLRLLSGADACDFSLHHHLVLSLLANDYERARQIVGFFSARRPRLVGEVLDYSSAHLGDELEWYSAVYNLNDLPESSLQLVAPSLEASQRARGLINESLAVISSSSPELQAEIEAFRPLWILATASESSSISFGGYSSSIAWGSVALNTSRLQMATMLIQMIHELAHQLLFALSIDVPLVYNHPEELYSSPLRSDPRPMDGVVHAYFVSARVYEVLSQIVCSPCYQSMALDQQQIIEAAMVDSAAAVRAALPTIETSARLSGIGERVVLAARQAVINQ